MKRKLAAVLTAAVCAVTLLGGCGNDTVSTSSGSVSTSGSNTVSSDQTAGNTKDNSRSSGAIKFSELFKNDVYVYKYERSVGTEITKSTDISYVAKYKSDGRYEGDYIGSEMGPLGQIAQKSDEEFFTLSLESMKKERGSSPNAQKERTGSYKIGIATDGTGNNTDHMVVGQDSFRAFLGHVTIYNASFMAFRGKYSTSDNSYYYCYLIRDTDETKDKQVVFDEMGTEGILIDASADELWQLDKDKEVVQNTEFSTELPDNSVSDTE